MSENEPTPQEIQTEISSGIALVAVGIIGFGLSAYSAYMGRQETSPIMTAAFCTGSWFATSIITALGMGKILKHNR